MIPIWIIVTLVLLGLLIFLFKSMDQVYVLSLLKEHFFYLFAIAVFVFIAISVTTIYNQHNIDITSYEGFMKGAKIYMIWLKNVVVNMAEVTGHAFKQDWTNITTNSTK